MQNQIQQSQVRLFYRLWYHITERRRKQFGLLFILMILVSFAEIFSIGAVIPFLAVLTNPDRIFELPQSQPFIQILGLSSANELILPIAITFGIAAIVAGTLRLILLWASNRLSYAAGADLSISIYRRTLYQPYSVHVLRNSSEIINGISSKAGVVINTINSVLVLLGSGVILMAILITLISIDPINAFLTFGSFGSLYIIIIKLSSKKQLEYSNLIAKESTQVIKALQEGLGGIRDILIDGNQEAYCKIYRKADIPLRRAQGGIVFIAQSPRYGMEALGMVLVAILAYSLTDQGTGIAKAVPILGVLALGAQRLLPVLQQAYQSLANIKAGQVSFQDALELLDQPLPEHASKPIINSISFEGEIQLNGLGFRYNANAPWVLQNIDLTIHKGECIGLIGRTGSGKSTLTDIIMGLLQPTRGELKIDGIPITPMNCRSWQQHIAHVPQVIFLGDGTIEENIAFGVPRDKIDFKKVRLAAQRAQISETIEGWEAQYQTVVGERGVRLSGGQRQRIGIARALYKEVDVIIFDEATSSLDSLTEQAVIDAIDDISKTLTVIIVAHRITTLKSCTQIVELGSTGILRVGSYQEVQNLSIRVSE